MAETVYTTCPGAPNERSVGELAGLLRRDLQNDEKIIHHICAFTTYLSTHDDKSRLVYGARLNLERDVIVSSYANVKACEMDFGPVLGGRPEAMRVPYMETEEGDGGGFAITMPKDADGSVAVAVCLGRGEMERLGSMEVGRFGVVVG
jgi:trichothecene 3-O-acetyltransferase